MNNCEASAWQIPPETELVGTAGADGFETLLVDSSLLDQGHTTGLAEHLTRRADLRVAVHPHLPASPGHGLTAHFSTELSCQPDVLVHPIYGTFAAARAFFSDLSLCFGEHAATNMLDAGDLMDFMKASSSKDQKIHVDSVVAQGPDRGVLAGQLLINGFEPGRRSVGGAPCIAIVLVSAARGTLTLEDTRGVIQGLKDACNNELNIALCAVYPDDIQDGIRASWIYGRTQ